MDGDGTRVSRRATAYQTQIEDEDLEEEASSTLLAGTPHGSVCDPSQCKVTGMSDKLTAKLSASFVIEAFEMSGVRKNSGGDGFFVAIRGASRVRARITDQQDGTYVVEWTPHVSGDYHIAISLFGVSIAGSPFYLQVAGPGAYSPNCEVSGNALYTIHARTTHSFEVRFRDKNHNVAQAVDLDVYVVPQPEALATDGDAAGGGGGGAGMPSAWDLATRPASNVSNEEANDAAVLQRGGGKGAKAAAAAAKQWRDKASKGSAGAAAARQQPQAAPEPVAADSGGEGSGAMDDGEGSADEATHREVSGREMDGVVTKQRPLQIQVGKRPLIVRSDASLDSAMMGSIESGARVTVVEERITEECVRACITFEPTVLVITSARGTPVAPVGVADAPAVEQAQAQAEATGDEATAASSTAGEAAESVPTGQESVGGGSGGGVQLQTGWVTLKRNGRKLVSSRVRLESTQRRQFQSQWERRLLNDKHHSDGSNVQTEVRGDPTGVGFAYGGVYPGLVYSKGRLHETHKVSYSVGKVGKYLLHVRLRQQAKPVPGSPFALTVLPGGAHPSATAIAVQELRGTVGTSADSGCVLVMQAADQMGNLCTRGGANVALKLLQSKTDQRPIEYGVTDNGDGTYTMNWRSKFSGDAQSQITIDGKPVRGSPVVFKLQSTNPELSKSELDCDGLRSATAGQVMTLRIRFFDSYGNLAVPGDDFKFGIAMSSELKKKINDVRPAENAVEWLAPETGECSLKFQPTTAGNQELHVWSDPQGKGERIAFPGSPFPMHVTAGLPTAEESYVDGYTKVDTKESQKEMRKDASPAKRSSSSSLEDIIAGDLVSVRPFIIDQYGNTTQLPDGSLTATATAPDGSLSDLSLLQQTKTSGLVNYEVRYEPLQRGPHEVHLKLDGIPIRGSPITFEVQPAAPEPQMCKLLPPKRTDGLVADYDHATVLVVKTFDKHGNACSTGGLPSIHARLQLIKQSSSDQTVLLPQHHQVTVDDQGDGTYSIKVQIRITAMVKLFVNMDKNMPPSVGELPALQLGFVKPEDDEHAVEAALADAPSQGSPAEPSPAGAAPAEGGPPADAPPVKQRRNSISSGAELNGSPPASRSPSPLSARC